MAELQFLPDANFRQLRGGAGRASASAINERANDVRDLTATVAARGTLLPILYGRRDVPGLVFAVGTIGTDLVIGYIWCVGEIDAVEAIYLNDAVLPAGVTATHYTGTPTQGVDATLAAAVPAYNDTLRIDTPRGKRGVAYSVVRIPTGKLSGFPRARAVLRGLKLYDPRTATTSYKDNPALVMANLAGDLDFGPGLAVSGVEEAADWDDSLLGGVVERARIALYIAAGRRAMDYLDLIAEYAECYYVFEGAGIRLIPDAPVDLETVPVITAADIIQGSLQITAESSVDTPTEVEVQYTEPASPATDPWGMESARVSLAGVDEGDVSRIPTSVTLEGVYRQPEASNKALARLNRMAGRVRVEWQTLDAGVAYQVGDVVRIEHDARGVSLPVRIQSVAMAGPGRYRVSASRYDVSHYPSELQLPESIGTVPVGAIALLSGSVVPDGWADFSAADGKYIVGAGTSYAPGDSGGSATATIAGNTSNAGGHLGSASFYVWWPYYQAGQPSRFFPTDYTTPPHAHTYTTGAVTISPLRRRNRLIIKTGAAGLKFPQQAQAFGLGGLLSSQMQRLTDNAGRLLMADSASANAGSATQTVSIATGQTSDSHVHGYYNNGALDLDFGPFPDIYAMLDGGGLHAHTCTLTLTPSVKRRALALYGGLGDYDVIPGLIVMWSGSLAGLPANWVLCDGANGTPDLRDRFVEIAAAGSEGVAAGNNTVTAAGTTTSSSHSHKGAQVANQKFTTAKHEDTVSHNHTINGSAAWVPPYYALAFIMFAPAS